MRGGPNRISLQPPAASDPFRHVRAMAVEVVAGWVHEDREAVTALSAARDDDPAPGGRKKAGWYAPGGVIFRKTSRSR